MRIALVDSSRTVLHIVGDLLEKGGHEVRAFTDGRAALDFVREDETVRALITSAEPASMSGIQLCAEGRKLAGARRPLYIILMSSTTDRDFVVQALDHGADDFVHKPPVCEELRARLRAAERLTSMQHELVKLATTDPLTRLANRRAFFEQAEQMVARRTGGAPASAIVVDIDHFKKVNDASGHQVGDEVLRAVAAEIAAVVGVSGRLGGEEFCILVEGGLADAAELAEDLRRSVGRLRFAAARGPFAITCSCGVAELELGDDIDRLLHRADMALYQAKLSGRDRVIAADAPAAPEPVVRPGTAQHARLRAG